MSTKKITGSAEAWESGQLGADEAFVSALDPADQAAVDTLVDDALALRPISIRLEDSLINAFKEIATVHGLGYQTLMRQALKRFADCENKRIVAEMAEQLRRKQRTAKTRKVA